VDPRRKTVIIEHKQRPGYKLLDGKPSETTADAYRFEVNVGGNATETFAVREERVYDQTLSISSITPDIIATYSQNKALSEAGRRQLDQIAQKKRDIAANDGQLRQAQADLNSLTQDEERQRRNIESLRNVAGQQNLVQQYASQLAAAEVKLTGLRDQESALQRKKTTLDAELNGLIEKAEF
jgi:chromosome segregation ATPase